VTRTRAYIVIPNDRGHQPADIAFMEQTRAWFDMMWDNISYEFPVA
jgi:hypothetical protein